MDSGDIHHLFGEFPSTRKLLFFCLIMISFNAHIDAQHKKEIVADVATLCSGKFAGRGYVKNGHVKTANFIKKRFQSLSVKPIDGRYFQKVSFPVNVFNGVVSLKVNNNKIEPGVDFVVDAASPRNKIDAELFCVPYHSLINLNIKDSLLKLAKGKLLAVVKQSPLDTSKLLSDSVRKIIHVLKNDVNTPLVGIIQQTNDVLKWGIKQRVNKIAHVEVSNAIQLDNSKKITLRIESNFAQNINSQNVVGMIPGTVRPDSFIVFTAHYDHLGMMGNDALFPGANDNASGTAMLLSLAKHYSENKPKYTVVFIAFTGEEVGLIGSKYFVENSLFPLKNIRFLINLDMAGSGENGLKIVNGSNLKKEFELLKSINDSLQLVPSVNPRVEGCISDQCYFYKAGVPCFFIYTMGNATFYHDVFDTPETLTLHSIDNYMKLVTLFANKLEGE